MVVCVCVGKVLFYMYSFICLYICLPVCLYICLLSVSVLPSIFSSIGWPIYFFIFVFAYLLVCLFISWLVDWLINWLIYSLIHWCCKLHTHCIVWNDSLCLIMSTKRHGRKWLWLLSVSRQNLVATYLFLFWGIFVFIFIVLPFRFCDFFCLYTVCCNSNFLRLIIGLYFRYIIDGDEPTVSKPPLWKWVLRIIMLLLQFAPVLRFLTSKT